MRPSPPALLLRTLSTLAALALGGCATTARCPESGGRAWWEVRSEHFVLQTDLERSEAVDTVRALERLRSAEARSMGLAQDPPGRLRAILFADFEALQGFGADERLGGYIHYGSEPFAVMHSWPASWRVRRPFEILAHELAHYLLVVRLGRPPPRWLAEGVAVRLGTLEVDEFSEAAVAGMLPDQVSVLRWEQAPLTLEELWRWEGNSGDAKLTDGRYASSWAWVHVLKGHEPERFERFLERLVAGEASRAAFDAEFSPGLLAGLAERVARVAQEANLRPRLEQIAAPRYQGPVSERALSPAEVHGVFARVWSSMSSRASWAARSARARVELAKALRHDGRYLEARLSEVHHGESRKARLEAARELSAVHPLSAKAWLAVAQHSEAKEREEAIERTAALAASDSNTLNSAAWYHVEDGRGPAALPMVMSALQISPWDSALIDTYAAALALSGRCREAIAEQTRAVQLLDDEVDEKTRADYVRRLRIYERGCLEPPAVRGDEDARQAPRPAGEAPAQGGSTARRGSASPPR